MKPEAVRQLISDIYDANQSAVLFLGQQYLSSMTGEDPFLKRVHDALCPDAPAFSDYYGMWEALGNNLTADDFAQIAQAQRGMETLPWLRFVMDLPWNLVYTSAVDTCMKDCVGPNRHTQSIDLSMRPGEPYRYSKKTLRNCVHLYGKVTAVSPDEYTTEEGREQALMQPLPPANCDTRRDGQIYYDTRAEGYLSWIYDYLLKDYNQGVLVIDGWDPATDWMEDLLKNAAGKIMTQKAIYIFGATEDMKQNRSIRALISDNKVVLVKERFAQVLAELYDFDDTDEDEQDMTGFKGQTITIRSDKGTTYVPISDSALKDISAKISPNVFLIYDGFAPALHIDGSGKETAFAQYLQHADKSRQWSLSRSFYFPRSFDKKLRDEVYRAAGRDAMTRRVILLEGPSNSGKTASLMNLALELRRECRFPVLYISGTPREINWQNELKEWLQLNLKGKQDKDGRLLNVVIIWDAGNTAHEKNYVDLARNLVGCQPIVVGAIYRCHPKSEQNKDCISIPVNLRLQEDEMRSFVAKLSEVNGDMARLFKQSAKNSFYNKDTDISFLAVLQRIANFRNSEEWRVVRRHISAQFRDEMEYTESDLSKQVELQLKEIEETYEKSAAKGVGSAWQIALQQQWEQATGEKTGAVSDEEREKLKLQEKALELVQRMNGILAMAGEFIGGQALPEGLVFRVLFSKYRNQISMEQMYQLEGFLRALLQNDLLVEREEGMVRFRHVADAEKYAEENFGASDVLALKDARRDKEVELLCELIRHCDWENMEEGKIVNLLIKCFGTNSGGRYKREVEGGKKHRDFFEYMLDIARCMGEYVSQNAYAVATYAHFIREYYTPDKETTEKRVEAGLAVDPTVSPSEWRIAERKLRLEEKDRLISARELLEIAKNSDTFAQDGFLRNIISGEICSNKQAQLRCTISTPKLDGEQPDSDMETLNIDEFVDFKVTFDQTIADWDFDRSVGMDFRPSSLLDIWMNAVENFARSIGAETAPWNTKFREMALLPSLLYVDQLFDPADMAFRSGPKMKKVQTVLGMVSKIRHDNRYRELEQQMLEHGNDTPLYLRCWQIWYGEDFDADMPQDTDLAQAEDVEKAQEILTALEQYPAIVRQSARCTLMQLRSQWMVWTGYMPLSEKQQILLTATQWKEINRIAARYAALTESDKHRSPMPLFLHAVSEYLYGDRRMAMDMFRDRYIKDSAGPLLSRTAWIMKRIGLCYGETNAQGETVAKRRLFAARYGEAKANTRDGGRWASIERELTEEKHDGTLPNMIGARQVYLSANDIRAENNSSSDTIVGSVWFNAQGPVLDREVFAEQGGDIV